MPHSWRSSRKPPRSPTRAPRPIGPYCGQAERILRVLQVLIRSTLGGPVDQATIPHQCSVRLDTLALSSTEAFVLSQIDGVATLEDVGDATGVPVAQVIAIAERLEELGAIGRPKPGSRAATSGRYAD